MNFYILYYVYKIFLFLQGIRYIKLKCENLTYCKRKKVLQEWRKAQLILNKGIGPLSALKCQGYKMQ